MSKIPEGATHTYSNSNGTTYLKKVDGIWHAYADGDWWRVSGPADKDFEPIQDEPEWSGEGLPPAGLVCEYLSPKLSDWIRAKVLFSGSRIAVLVIVEGSHYGAEAAIMTEVIGGGASRHLRPIRTPEQIAAEKRDAAIKEMQRLVGSCNTFPFAELYDYGYRLQVEK